MIHDYVPGRVEELLPLLKEGDFVRISAGDFIELIESRKSNAGRKAIMPDGDVFREVVSRWKSGEITARSAMTELNLKPNTFYRRVKELSEMTDIKAEIKDAIREEKKELRDLKAQVKAEAKETKQLIKEEAKDTVSAKKMEKEILKEKLEAEVSHAKEIKELEKEVHSEAREFKSNS